MMNGVVEMNKIVVEREANHVKCQKTRAPSFHLPDGNCPKHQETISPIVLSSSR